MTLILAGFGLVDDVSTTPTSSLVLRGWSEDGHLRVLVKWIDRFGTSPPARLVSSETEVLEAVHRWILTCLDRDATDDGGRNS